MPLIVVLATQGKRPSPLTCHTGLVALCIALTLGAPAKLHAQDAPQRIESDEPASDHIPALDTLRVTATRPETEVVDLYGFENPVQVEGTRFERRWQEAPSLEEVGMQGGYIALGIAYGLQQVQKGARRLPGWKLPERPATARPPPLSTSQMQRALSLCGDQDILACPQDDASEEAIPDE